MHRHARKGGSASPNAFGVRAQAAPLPHPPTCTRCSAATAARCSASSSLGAACAEDAGSTFRRLKTPMRQGGACASPAAPAKFAWRWQARAERHKVKHKTYQCTDETHNCLKPATKRRAWESSKNTTTSSSCFLGCGSTTCREWGWARARSARQRGWGRGPARLGSRQRLL